MTKSPIEAVPDVFESLLLIGRKSFFIINERFSAIVQELFFYKIEDQGNDTMVAQLVFFFSRVDFPRNFNANGPQKLSMLS